MAEDSPPPEPVSAAALDAALAAFRCGDLGALQKLLEDSGSGQEGLLRALRSSEAGPSALRPGLVFEGLEIQGRIGQGGMGTVYAARESTTGRELALKVSRLDPMAGDQSLTRALWQREVGALSRLQHANIASLYRVGSSPEGLEYLVLERVQGAHLDLCPQVLTTAEEGTLALVDQLGAGIDYAHRRGVLHLDLKPSNVLVDDEGQVKILDFGMARLRAQEAGEASQLSVPRAMVGTLPYLAPEQVEGDGDLIDTRTDVYAIGVILYRLLVGRLPFAGSVRQPLQLAERIRQGRCPRPTSLRPELAPDLEAIICQAMAVDSEQRYQSVRELLADLERYRAGEPVLARPAGPWLRLRKLVARHRRLTVASALALVLLAAAWAATGLALVQAQAAERDARNSQLRAERSQRYIAEILALARPQSSGEARDDVSYLLDRASAALAEDTAGDPWLEAAARQALGRAYVSRGRHAAGVTHLRRVWQLRRESLPADPVRMAEARRDLGFALHAQGELAAAEPHLAEALRERLRLFPAYAPQIMQSREELANLWFATGRPDAGRRQLEVCVAQMRDDPQTPSTALADALTHLGRYLIDARWEAAALPILAEALQLRQADQPAARLWARRLLIRARDLLGDPGVLVEARALCGELERAVGPVSLELAGCLEHLALTESRLLGSLQAVPAMERAVSICLQRLGPKHARTLALHGQRDRLLVSGGEIERGLAGLEEGLASTREALGDEHVDVFKAAVRLGWTYAEHQRSAGLEQLMPLLERLFARQKDVDCGTELSYLRLRGRALRDRDPVAADTWFVRARRRAAEIPGVSWYDWMVCEVNHADHLRRQRKLPEALRLYRGVVATEPARSPNCRSLWAAFIELLAETGATAEAREVADRMLPEIEIKGLPSHQPGGESGGQSDSAR